MEAATQSEVEIDALAQLFTLHAQQSEKRGVEAELLLLDIPQISGTDPITPFCQFKSTLVIANIALEKQFTLGQILGCSKAIFHLT